MCKARLHGSAVDVILRILRKDCKFVTLRIYSEIDLVLAKEECRKSHPALDRAWSGIIAEFPDSAQFLDIGRAVPQRAKEEGLPDRDIISAVHAISSDGL